MEFGLMYNFCYISSIKIFDATDNKLIILIITLHDIIKIRPPLQLYHAPPSIKFFPSLNYIHTLLLIKLSPFKNLYYALPQVKLFSSLYVLYKRLTVKLSPSLYLNSYTAVGQVVAPFIFLFIYCHWLSYFHIPYHNCSL